MVHNNVVVQIRNEAWEQLDKASELHNETKVSMLTAIIISFSLLPEEDRQRMIRVGNTAYNRIKGGLLYDINEGWKLPQDIQETDNEQV